MASIINTDEFSAKNGSITFDLNTSLDLSATSYIAIPSGTTAERQASPTSGSIRWNEDLEQFEVYDGNIWRVGRRYYDFDLMEGFPVLELDSSNRLESYPDTLGRKWFSNSFSPYKAIFANTPNYSTANNGYFEFNGTSHYATVEIDDGLRPTTSLSQEVWFNTSASNTSQVFIGLQYGISSNNAYALWSTGSAWQAGVNQSGSLSTISQPFTSTPMSNNTWYYYGHSYNSQNFVIRGVGVAQAGSNVMEIVDAENQIDDFDYHVGMTIVAPSIFPNDPAADPAVLTTITSVDAVNRTVTVDQTALQSTAEFNFTATLAPCQILYLNGEPIKIDFMSAPENIAYTTENTLLTIGADFNGPNVNSGPVSYVNGDMSIVRVHASSMRYSQFRNNYNVIKGRYGL